jgi:hypothetical protein
VIDSWQRAPGACAVVRSGSIGISYKDQVRQQVPPDSKTLSIPLFSFLFIPSFPPFYLLLAVSQHFLCFRNETNAKKYARMFV